jgi:hypothetical protein
VFPTIATNAFAAGQKTSFMAKSAQLPGSSIGTVPMFYFGRELKFAGNRTFAQWSLQIINDEDFVIRNSLESWMNAINSHAGNLRTAAAASSSGYTVDALVTQFGKTGNTLKQYKFVGVFPIDFDKHTETGKCLIDTLCSTDLRSIHSKGYNQFGLIFNTDVAAGPGQHWVSVFCDISPELDFPRMTYFDSYAHKPEKEIQVLMRRWKKQWDATNLHSKPMKLTYNGTRHQYEDSECGMYSVYFHYCCLMGIPMDKRIPDEVVRGFRGLLFKVK